MITMSQKSVLPLLEAMFPHEHGNYSQQVSKVKYLQTQFGAKVSFGVFMFKISYAKGTSEINVSRELPFMAAKFDTLNHMSKDMVRKMVSSAIEEAMLGVVPNSLNFSDQPVAVSSVTGLGSIAAKIEAASLAGLLTNNLQLEVIPDPAKLTTTAPDNKPTGAVMPVSAVAKPVPDVVLLKDARALSQRVNGTSGGSVYRVCAVGLVNIAVKTKVKQISLRAEFQGSREPSIVTALTSMGFGDHGNYLSMHLSGDGPGFLIPRIIGSVIFGSNTKFEQVATTLEQINA